MAITAAQVKELREKTGAGMMDCKKALTDSDGDIDGAVKYLREKGLATAAKRAGKVAAEGAVVAQSVSAGEAVMIELNCETDFVAKTEGFQSLAGDIASAVGGRDLDGVQEAEAAGVADMTLASGKTVADAIADGIASMGENVLVRRVARLAPGDGTGVVGSYIHGGGKIGVLVEAKTGASGDAVGEVSSLLRDLAMQVAAASPRFTRREDVPAAELDKEREIFRNQAAQSGKPDKVIEKIVGGKVEKFFSETCLVEQEFIKDSQLTVAKLVEQVAGKVGSPIEVTRFVRMQLGDASEG